MAYENAGSAPLRQLPNALTIARFAAMDMPASSTRTRSTLGWQPKQPGLIADLDQDHYFA